MVGIDDHVEGRETTDNYDVHEKMNKEAPHRRLSEIERSMVELDLFDIGGPFAGPRLRAIGRSDRTAADRVIDPKHDCGTHNGNKHAVEVKTRHAGRSKGSKEVSSDHGTDDPKHHVEQ
jgi:hypothetical protein